MFSWQKISISWDLDTNMALFLVAKTPDPTRCTLHQYPWQWRAPRWGSKRTSGQWRLVHHKIGSPSSVRNTVGSFKITGYKYYKVPSMWNIVQILKFKYIRGWFFQQIPWQPWCFKSQVSPMWLGESGTGGMKTSTWGIRLWRYYRLELFPAY